MKMNFKDELNQALDYSRVLQEISAYASFSLSKEKIEKAMPMHDLNRIKEQLDLVKEAADYLRTGAVFNMSGCSDVSDHVKQASKKMTLLPMELLDIHSFLTACRTVKQSLRDIDQELLKDLADTLDPCHPLIRRIQDQIDMSGSVRDDATEKLRKLTFELVDVRASLTNHARAFVKQNSARLMENMTTTIGGRVCVLVKAQDKNSFGGMIHGQSQSGLAYYAEPSSFVSLNNQVQSLLSEIEEEKNRICRELSAQVGKESMKILSNLETMTIIDTAFTKARWCIRFDGCIPLIQTKDHTLILEYARHPLIDEKRVVANTYRLDPSEYCLMISGPNMGGKTVTLKTIGLFIALSHAGFPVLCHRAVIPLYRSMWFDIGDNQSIENNLSTFSGHISKISEICRRCDSHAFVLLDEPGNGTDPLEGACLAEAVLSYLMEKRCTILTSTHYSTVKAFGKANKHVLVSSVEFDRETLMPTYRYIPGVSGASYAFSIARQFRLKESIIEHAESLKEKDEDRVQKELENLERLQNEALNQKERFDQLIKEAHRIQKEAAADKEKWESKYRELNEDYEMRLNAMLEEKEEEAQAIIRELRAGNADKMHEKSELLHQIHSMAVVPEEKETDEVFQVGDYVLIEGLNSHGAIIDLRKKQATVDANGMKMTVKLSQLKKIHKPMVTQKSSKAHTDKVFTRVPTELNIIGCRVEEGLKELDYYLDQAVAHNLKQVRIIHGVGTGKLRAAVWKDLDKHPAVKSKTAAGPGEGGLGATIVVLK